jgi:hypothetical protein
MYAMQHKTCRPLKAYTQVKDLPPLTANSGDARRRYVYFIRCSGYVKIGTAIDVRARMASIKASNPNPIDIIAIIPASDDTEKRLHERFHPLRHKGEWFRPDKAIDAFLKKVQRDGLDKALDGTSCPECGGYIYERDLETWDGHTKKFTGVVHHCYICRQCGSAWGEEAAKAPDAAGFSPTEQGNSC